MNYRVVGDIKPSIFHNVDLHEFLKWRPQWSSRPRGRRVPGSKPDSTEEPPCDANVTKNVDGAGRSLVCSVAHGDKVYYPSATKLSVTVWMGAIIPISGESRFQVGGAAEVIQFLHRRDECQTA
ncbi:hypothetical protein AVEN_209584-1 [Araneus ventricosus]|uniref:Uncharacterized protein n=1 Tax=Araneus ventricosus TaxID=182803 RepID=A0A4Y2X4W8_ARAVE|nr:hypothetical protein AVEN_209584-1 [Araneus ventricosus]